MKTILLFLLTLLSAAICISTGIFQNPVAAHSFQLKLIAPTYNINLPTAMLNSSKKHPRAGENSSPVLIRDQYIHKLPEPLQRYVHFALPDTTPLISGMKLTHSGDFKPSISSDWTPIRGEQQNYTHAPIFRWKGRTRLFTAVDFMDESRGGLNVRLLHILPILRARGPHIDQGELLRWLGEAAWYPTLWFDNPAIKWTTIDKNRVRLDTTIGEHNLHFILEINESGEITRMESERYMDTETMHPWIIEISDYRLKDGFMLPYYAEVSWILPEGKFTYARFKLESITLDTISK